jgi:hypothetical protein
VRDDGRQPGLIDTPPKPDNFVGSERLADPLVGVLAEDLQGLTAVNDPTIDGPGHPARNGHMGAYPHNDPSSRTPTVVRDWAARCFRSPPAKR